MYMCIYIIYIYIYIYIYRYYILNALYIYYINQKSNIPINIILSIIPSPLFTFAGEDDKTKLLSLSRHQLAKKEFKNNIV